MSGKSKFKAGDIVVSRSGAWKEPHVVLGVHTFPNGTPAYRLRSCLPQYDMDDGSELWPSRDSYMSQEFIDEFSLLWRRSSRKV